MQSLILYVKRFITNRTIPATKHNVFFESHLQIIYLYIEKPDKTNEDAIIPLIKTLIKFMDDLIKRLFIFDS